MLSMSRAAVGAILVTGGLCAAISAQEPGINVSCGVGVMADEDGCSAIGPDYRARFDAGGVTFVPALGARAPRLFPARFTPQTFGRAEGEAVPFSPASPRASERRIEYAHGDVTSRYDVRKDGIEQSFVFASLPAGSGDLVVRVAVDTKLRVASQTRDGIAFRQSDFGGIDVRGVVGIDAGGRRTGGTIAFGDGVIELRLPEAFVESAELPLILDPIIGPVIDVADFGFDEEEPDLAYDVTNARYLVVWQRRFSATDTDVRGRMIATDGTPLTSVLAVYSSIDLVTNISVANVNLRDTFVVVWEEGDDILARSVNAATAALSPVVGVATSPQTETSPEVAGEATLAAAEALCVWANVSFGDIEAAQISVQTDGTLTVFATQTVSTGSALSFKQDPSISKQGGGVGLYLVVWQAIGLFQSSGEIEAIAVDRNLVPQGFAIPVTNSVNGFYKRPDVDGDGFRWVVAFEREEGPSLASDVQCRSVRWDPIQARAVADEFPVRTIDGAPGVDEVRPCVGFLRGSVIVGYEDADGVNDVVRVASVDPFDCSECETSVAVSSLVVARTSRVATQASGGGSVEDGAMFVWEARPFSLDGDIFARRFEPADGTETDLGGGCGQGGRSRASCARRGNGSFSMRVRDARPNSGTFLVLSASRIQATCGACTFVPDPFTGSTFLRTTDSRGQASVDLFLPDDPGLAGLRGYLQWLVGNPTPGCSPLDADLSNAIEFQIQ